MSKFTGHDHEKKDEKSAKFSKSLYRLIKFKGLKFLEEKWKYQC